MFSGWEKKLSSSFLIFEVENFKICRSLLYRTNSKQRQISCIFVWVIAWNRNKDTAHTKRESLRVRKGWAENVTNWVEHKVIPLIKNKCLVFLYHLHQANHFSQICVNYERQFIFVNFLYGVQNQLSALNTCKKIVKYNNKHFIHYSSLQLSLLFCIIPIKWLTIKII